MKSKPLTPDQKIERIEKALHYAGDYHAWPDVQEGLMAGKYQIFDSDDGACVTEIIQLPRGRYLNVWIVGGRLPGVMELVPAMIRAARDNDCRQLVAFGRRGWKKVLPEYGWKEIGVVFAKDVTNA